MQFVKYATENWASPAAGFAQRSWRALTMKSGPKGGPKGPPSAPPTIPPIIINPFLYHQPDPAIDPRITPLGPPVAPPTRPSMQCAFA